jgi:predicted amidophosphoribosyltransferase
MTSPLESMYPNRCYDCLAAIPLDDLLCAKCQKVYADERIHIGDDHFDD